VPLSRGCEYTTADKSILPSVSIHSCKHGKRIPLFLFFFFFTLGSEGFAEGVERPFDGVEDPGVESGVESVEELLFNDFAWLPPQDGKVTPDWTCFLNSDRPDIQTGNGRG
jgi:hypothetical protein